MINNDCLIKYRISFFVTFYVWPLRLYFKIELLRVKQEGALYKEVLDLGSLTCAGQIQNGGRFENTEVKQ